jgi:hypothetical protein
MGIEEGRAAILREAVHAGFAEYLDEKYFVAAAVGKTDKRLIPGHMVVTQIAYDE